MFGKPKKDNPWSRIVAGWKQEQKEWEQELGETAVELGLKEGASFGEVTAGFRRLQRKEIQREMDATRRIDQSLKTDLAGSVSFLSGVLMDDLSQPKLNKGKLEQYLRELRALDAQAQGKQVLVDLGYGDIVRTKLGQVSRQVRRADPFGENGYPRTLEELRDWEG